MHRFWRVRFQRLVAGLILFLFAVDGRADEPLASPRYAEHLDLSYVLRPDGSRAAIRTVADWQLRRRHILLGIEEAMGPLPRPMEPVPLAVEVVEEHRDGDILRRKLAYHTDDPNTQVKAWLLMPAEPAARPCAAVLCLHQTTKAGKDSPAGLADRPNMHLALELAKRGYVALAPDYPSFGEYRHDFDADEYQSGSMKAIYDNRRAVDVLVSLPEVDARRIGCIGHSLGGHNGLFTAVFDERIRAVVTSCGFTRFHKYKGGNLRGWSGPVYMPRAATKYNFSPDQMPFDFTEVVAALAPRPVFIVAPVNDDNFAVEGVRETVEVAQGVYELFGEAERLRVIYPDCAHDFPISARQNAYAFLDEFLAADR